MLWNYKISTIIKSTCKRSVNIQYDFINYLNFTPVITGLVRVRFNCFTDVYFLLQSPGYLTEFKTGTYFPNDVI